MELTCTHNGQGPQGEVETSRWPLPNVPNAMPGCDSVYNAIQCTQCRPRLRCMVCSRACASTAGSHRLHHSLSYACLFQPYVLWVEDYLWNHETLIVEQ